MTKKLLLIGMLIIMSFSCRALDSITQLDAENYAHTLSKTFFVGDQANVAVTLTTEGDQADLDLAVAALEGDEHKIKQALEAGANIETRITATALCPGDKRALSFLGINSYTPLHITVLKGHLTATSFLLAQGADPNAQTGGDRARTPLMLGACNTPILKALLQLQQSRLDIRDNINDTVLHAVTDCGNVSGLEVLLADKRSGNLVNVADNRGYTPLFSVVTDATNQKIAGKRVPMIKLLLTAGADIHQLHKSRKLGLLNGVLSNRREDREVWEILNFLLVAGANPNGMSEEQETPLALISSDEKIDSFDLELVALLLQAGANPTLANRGMQPIHYAARWGHTELLELLLEREDIDVNAMDSYGRTPLSIVLLGINNGNLSVRRALPAVTALLFHGARVTLEESRVLSQIGAKS